MKKQILLICCMVGILTGCGGDNDLCYRQLEKIDHRKNRELARQEIVAFQKDYQPKARYVLMYQKLIAAELSDEVQPFKNQEVARELVEYYEGERDREKLIRSYIIAGSVYANSSDGPKAIEYYRKAEFLLGEKGRSVFKIRPYQHMASLLVRHNMIDEAQKYANRVGYYCQENHDTLGMINAMTVLGECYRRSRMPGNEIATLQEAQRLASLSGQADMSRKLALTIAQAQYHAQAYQGALKSAMPLVGHEDDVYALLSQIYYALGKKDSAYYYGQKAMDAGRSASMRDAHEVLAHLCIERGDRRAAEEHLNQYIELNNELNHLENSEAIAQAYAFYHNQKQAEENALLRNENHQKQIYIILAISLLIVLLVLFATYFQRHRRRQELMASRIQQLEELRDAYEQTDEQERSQTEQVVRQSEIYQCLATMDESAHPSEDDWQALADIINLAYERFTPRLLSLCRMSTHEYRVCLLLKAGFEPVRIATLTLRSKAAISTVRSRLYEKAFGKKGSPKDWDEVIRTL